MKISYKIAVGGIVSALCLVIMFLTGVFPIFYIVLPMVAGLLIRVIVDEISLRWALLTYVSVSVLSVLLANNPEAALIFILFFGNYPILKKIIDGLKIGLLRKFLKLVFFFAVSYADYHLTVFVIGVDESINDLPFSAYWEQILIIALVVFFVVYDLYMDIFINDYEGKLRKMIFRR